MARIPETLVFGHGFDHPTLVYSTYAGKVEKFENITSVKVTEFINSLQKPHPKIAPKSFV
jgi:hypothetical protein